MDIPSFHEQNLRKRGDVELHSIKYQPELGAELEKEVQIV
jgi:hypothetical protein